MEGEKREGKKGNYYIFPLREGVEELRNLELRGKGERRKEGEKRREKLLFRRRGGGGKRRRN